MNLRVTVVALAVALHPIATIHAQPADAPKPTVARNDGDGARILARAWWNNPRSIEKFVLTREQRTQMDAKFLGHLQGERRARESARELRTVIDDRIAAGKWEDARVSAKQLGERQIEVLHNQVNARIEVLSLLTEEQRQKIAKDNPRILRSNWSSSPGGRRGQGGRRQQAGE